MNLSWPLSEPCRNVPEGTINPENDYRVKLKLKLTSFILSARSKTPPFEIEDECNAADILRLEYRYLDLRRTPFQERIRFRHEVVRTVRNLFKR